MVERGRRATRRTAAACLVMAVLVGASSIHGGTARAVQPAATVSIGNVTVVETNEGHQTARFTITLSEAQPSPLRVSWDLVEGTATAGEDFRPRKKAGTARIRAGRTFTAVAVRIEGDTTVEADEFFSVVLLGTDNADVGLGRAIGTGTIIDANPATPTVSIGDVSLGGDSSGRVRAFTTVSLSEPQPVDVFVTWDVVAGTALPGVDYRSLKSPRTTRIRAGRTSTILRRTVFADPGRESNRSFAFQIVDVSNADIGRSTGTVTLLRALRPNEILLDSFDRRDTVELGRAETGQLWEVSDGGWGVTDNRARKSSSGYGLVLADVGESDGTYEVSVPIAEGEFWAVVRATHDGRYWRFGRVEDGDYTLQRIEWGVVTAEPAPLTAVTPAPGDLLACGLAGESITCSVNGTPVAQADDPFLRVETRVGLAAFGADAEPPVRFDEASFSAEPAPALRVTAASSAPSVTQGDTFSYSVAVTNRGRADASSALLEVALPHSVTLATAMPSQGSCGEGGGVVTCSLGTLAPGGTAEVVLDVDADEPGIARVVASVFLDDPGAVVDQTASAAVVVVADPLGDQVVDTFSRADQASLGTAESGQAWTEDLGDWAVIDGRAEQTSPAYALVTLDTGRSSGTYEVLVEKVSLEMWVVFRVADSTNYWRFGRSNAGSYLLQKIEGNAATDVGVYESPSPVMPADGDVVSVGLDGDSVAVRVNGVPVVSADDPFNAAATRLGMAGFRTSFPGAAFGAILSRSLFVEP
jgi:uncharacterized repeat protein (TIGR01451 family)